MKVHTHVIIDIKTGDVEHDDFFDYEGPVALCGGGSHSTSVDKEYNKGLLEIQQRQQGIADEYFAFWKETQKPYEEAQAQVNMELLPFEKDAYKQQKIAEELYARGQREIIPLQTNLSKASIQDQIDTLGMMQPVKTNFFQQAAQGKDVGGAMAQAQADAAKGFEDAAAATSRAMGRMGVNPASGRYAGVNAEQDLAKAAAVAGARTQARTEAQDENFRRLAMGMQFGMGGR